MKLIVRFFVSFSFVFLVAACASPKQAGVQSFSPAPAARLVSSDGMHISVALEKFVSIYMECDPAMPDHESIRFQRKFLKDFLSSRGTRNWKSVIYTKKVEDMMKLRPKLNEKINEICSRSSREDCYSRCNMELFDAKSDLYRSYGFIELPRDWF